MLKYDCNYVDILHHPNVTVLYSFGIEKMLKGCEGLAQTDRIASLMDLGRQFAVIVKNEDEKNDMIDE
jgi:hypothetical protein